MRRVFLVSVFVVFLIFGFWGCKFEWGEVTELDYDRALPPGESALRKIRDPRLYPDFTLGCLDLTGLEEAIDNSLNYLSKPSSERYFPKCGISHHRVVESLEAVKGLLDSGLRGAELSEAMERKFDVYMSVGYDGEGTVLYTGYYTPIFEGSPVRTERFRYPLYKKPDNLVQTFDGEILGRRLADGSVEPYPGRAVIESSDILEGKELVWLDDPFKVYVAHVQGSAKIRMPDGELITVGYAASNGHEYKSVGKKLVEDGVFSESELSLSSMLSYFEGKPELVREYTSFNPRFIFFRKQKGAPRGSLNEPVTEWRTIATDKSIFPRAAVTFVRTYLPQYDNGEVVQEIYSGFALDQDTGGAVRAAGRCDFYMGIGEKAGKLAGRTRKEGKLYYLFVKENQE